MRFLLWESIHNKIYHLNNFLLCNSETLSTSITLHNRHQSLTVSRTFLTTSDAMVIKHSTQQPHLLLRPWKPRFCLPFLQIYLVFQVPYKNGIMQYVSFIFWPGSLSIKVFCSSSIDSTLQDDILFVKTQYSAVDVPHCWCIHLLVALGAAFAFWLLWIMQSWSVVCSYLSESLLLTSPVEGRDHTAILYFTSCGTVFP